MVVPRLEEERGRGCGSGPVSTPLPGEASGALTPPLGPAPSGPCPPDWCPARSPCPAHGGRGIRGPGHSRTAQGQKLHPLLPDATRPPEGPARSSLSHNIPSGRAGGQAVTRVCLHSISHFEFTKPTQSEPRECSSRPAHEERGQRQPHTSAPGGCPVPPGLSA